MKIQHQVHRHGGRITAITAIEHGTHEGRPHWHFRGDVAWFDGSTSKDIEIAPTCVCHDGEEVGAPEESAAVFEKLSDYLARNGRWVQRGAGGWKPKAKTGREAIA